MKNIFGICFVVTLIDIVVSQSTYKAAVLEYAPKACATTWTNCVLENAQKYVDYIAEAADKEVDIIVFPESGLFGVHLTADNVDELSMEVPDPELKILPCDEENTKYSKALVDLSCAAKTHGMYVVVNIVEKHYNSSNATYYNTNIVFDRQGALFSRFRKIKLYMEAFVIPGNEIVTFKTDFGVTFGMFICNDIMFKFPALDTIADLNVTDVIYSTAWYSELPFLESLSIAHGFAKSNGINLLVSELSEPAVGNGGSAIFLANGKIAGIFKSAAKSSKMIISAIPKIDKQNKIDYQYQPVMGTTFEDRIWGTLPNISNFFTYQHDMSNFTFKTINLNNTNIKENICIGTYKQFCCSIDLTTTVNSSQNYEYKLAVYNGGYELGWETIGIRTCGLVACLNTSEASCGLRHSTAPKGVTFEKLTIKASFPYVENAHDQPSTVKYDLQPIDNYNFTKEIVGNNSIEITVTTTNQTQLLTFGIFGRVYDNDNKGTGSFNSAATYIIRPYIVFMISVFLFVTQE